MRQQLLITFLAAVLILCLTSLTMANPVSQEFPLANGWNAVFLEVEPADPDPTAVFAGISGQLVSVWMWNPNTGTVEFIQNPEVPVPEQSTWLAYYPPAGDGAPDELQSLILSNLHAIHGNRAYLIQTDAAATLTVSGEPLLPEIDWKTNAFNLVGFHLTADGEGTYEDFFSAYPEFTDASGNLSDIYWMNNGTGQWQKVVDPAAENMVKGQPLWIYCRGSSEFTGTVRVQVEQSGRLDFGEILSMQDIVIYNISDDAQSISLNLDPPTFPLYYQLPPTSEDLVSWTPFSSGYTSPEAISAGETLRLRLGVKRSDLAPGEDAAANLTLPASNGSQVMIPVSVKGVNFSGLWAGHVTLDQVNQIHEGDDSTLQPTGSKFTFRLLLHHDGSSTRILNQAVEVLSGESYVLYSDNIPVQGTFGRRISAPAFGNFTGSSHNQQMTPSGSFGTDGTSLTVSWIMAAADPLNPFIHAFNPEHKSSNLDYGEYEIARDITLTFGGSVDGTGNFIGWGSSEVGGIYEETFSGLSRDNIQVKGTFRIRKISNISTLNPGL